MRKPNFFLIGAPKCGTTAMSQYLRTHPNVYLPSLKEPTYFCKDILSSTLYRTEAEYLSLFRKARPEHGRVGEASTTYLRSKAAIDGIREFDSQAKLVVMLRNPVDLVHAFHGETVWQGFQQRHIRFEDAWRSEVPDITKVQVSALDARWNLHWVGRIGTHLAYVFQVFQRSQVHWIIFDDFVRDPGHEYRQLLDFLGLDDDGRQEFPKVNESRRHRWLWLGHGARRLRRKAGWLFTTYWRITGQRGIGILRGIDRLNGVTVPRAPLEPELRASVQQVFRGEVALLEKLLDRDLSEWLGPPE